MLSPRAANQWPGLQETAVMFDVFYGGRFLCTAVSQARLAFCFLIRFASSVFHFFRKLGVLSTGFCVSHLVFWCFGILLPEPPNMNPNN